jgi:hypothetical protein
MAFLFSALVLDFAPFSPKETDLKSSLILTDSFHHLPIP